MKGIIAVVSLCWLVYVTFRLDQAISLERVLRHVKTPYLSILLILFLIVFFVLLFVGNYLMDLILTKCGSPLHDFLRRSEEERLFEQRLHHARHLELGYYVCQEKKQRGV